MVIPNNINSNLIRTQSNNHLKMDLEEVTEFKLFDSTRKDNYNRRSRPFHQNHHKNRRLNPNQIKRRR